MSKDPFSSSSGGAQLKANVGRLALFSPQEFVPNAVDGKFGKVDGIRCDVVFLDDGPGQSDSLAPDEADQMDGMVVINGPVVKELKPLIPTPAKVENGQVIEKAKPGGMHLGRVGEVENKKGNDPVIVLNSPTPADKTVARNYLAWLAGSVEDPFSAS